MNFKASARSRGSAGDVETAVATSMSIRSTKPSYPVIFRYLHRFELVPSFLGS